MAGSQQVQSQQENEHEAALNNWYKKRDKPQESLPKLGVVEKPPLSPEEQARAMTVCGTAHEEMTGEIAGALVTASGKGAVMLIMPLTLQ